MKKARPDLKVKKQTSPLNASHIAKVTDIRKEKKRGPQPNPNQQKDIADPQLSG